MAEANYRHTARRDARIENMVAANVSLADTVQDSDYQSKSNLIRVVAVTDVTIRHNNVPADRAMLLPEGTVEYFQSEDNHIYTITGTANVSSIDNLE